MATRVSYPVEVKMKGIEMRLTGIEMKEVMEQLNIQNKTQVKTWMRWYRSGEWNRLEQPVGKQNSYSKGPEHTSELEKIKAKNQYLKQQLDLLKKVQGDGKEVSPRIVVKWIESIREEVSVTQKCMDWAFSCHLLSLVICLRELIQGSHGKKIGELCRQHKFRYGYRKITALLRAEQRVNNKRAQRIMQRKGLQCRVRMKK
ncbi:IS3 family transposase [Paenibacillus polymyxa]|uniref:IS3 family transposase n=1 Tax=Paenibacillus polymyxa TaxID=1406 RepID=UPI00307EA86E